MTRALITGGSGFVGQWLCRELVRRDVKVFAGSVTGTPAIGVLSRDEVDAITWLPLNISSDDDVAAALDGSAPDWIVHLAGIAYPPEASASPLRALETNALGAQRLLTAIGAAGRAAGGPRLLIVGSAEQYGAHERDEQPLPETAAQCPISVYGASKACQELLALQFQRTSTAQVICTRSFNHSGAGQAPTYLLPALVSRASALPRTGGTLRIGNGTPVRDFLHVTDVVHAYILLLERGTPGEVYNVASGQGVTVSELARLVLKRAGVTADITTDPALMRPVDTPMLVGDNSKLRAATGWSPERTTNDIIDDLLHATTR
jgi:GDP-4-dehydro-6-deoxy-D-mannose reductase